MALAHVRWFSSTLLKSVSMNVILPETTSGPYRTLYLLHGLSDDYSTWGRRSRIEWYVRDLPLIVVMADGERGFYTDNADGPAYATFFGEELPSFVERNFRALSTREGRCVGGLSMGGYGALRLGLGYPDRYRSVTSHSGALFAWRYDERITSLGPEEHRRIFGGSAEGSSHDLLALAARARERGVLPRIRIDCGTDDFLFNVNQRFTGELYKLQVPHEYAEYPGMHDWDYWDLHVREAIQFHMADTPDHR